jgi:hypothetical protein
MTPGSRLLPAGCVPTQTMPDEKVIPLAVDRRMRLLRLSIGKALDDGSEAWIMARHSFRY